MIQALGQNLIPITAITFVFMFLVIWVVMATIDSIYKTKCNARLKEKLVDRGASADEIDQIIKSGLGDSPTAYVAPVPPVKVAHR